jgi:hypothetical protein
MKGHEKAWRMVYKVDGKVVRATLVDRLVQVVCGGFFVLALAVMVLKGPFSYVLVIPFSGGAGGAATLHSLSVLLVAVLFLFFWSKTLIQIPYVSRLALAAAFTVIGYEMYDTFWQLGLIFSMGQIVYPVGDRALVLNVDAASTVPGIVLSKGEWLVVPFAVVVFFWVWRRKYLPRVRLSGIILVLVLNACLIGWLASTGFYQTFLVSAYLNANGTVFADPHGWVWFVGKTLGILSWLFVFRKIVLPHHVYWIRPK